MTLCLQLEIIIVGQPLPSHPCIWGYKQGNFLLHLPSLYNLGGEIIRTFGLGEGKDTLCL